MAEAPVTAELPEWPPLPWGVWAAFAVFLIALALPVMKNTMFGNLNGLGAATYCAQEFVDLLRDPGAGISRLTLVRAALTIPNIAMLLSPGLAMLAPRHRRLWPAILASVFACQAAAYSVANGTKDLRALQIGYWAWVVSFVLLASSLWLWEARVRRAASSASKEAEDGDSVNVELK